MQTQSSTIDIKNDAMALSIQTYINWNHSELQQLSPAQLNNYPPLGLQQAQSSMRRRRAAQVPRTVEPVDIAAPNLRTLELTSWASCQLGLGLALPPVSLTNCQETDVLDPS